MDFNSIVKTRRSIRQYKTNPIPTEAVERLKQALSLAPSANNGQPCTFIFVTDPAVKAELVSKGCHQEGFAAAPLIVVACCRKDHKFDCAIAVDHMILAATAEGLGTCWVGWIEREAIRAILNIPEDQEIHVIIPVGYAAESPAARPRKPMGELIRENKW